MENFTFYSPTYFCFGKGEAEHTGMLVKRFGGHKVLLHYGSGSIKRNGVYEAVTTSLKEEGVPFVELSGVQSNPRSGLVHKGIELCRVERVDFILAVGGGSVIDSAKAIALGVPYGGDFWDFYAENKLVTQALPVGTVLTIAAAGSEGSTGSVITQENGMLKRAAEGDALRPKFSVMDPTYLTSLPRYQIACGITDMMAHVCERYFTNTKDVEVTDRICEAVLKVIIEQAPAAVHKGSYEALANIMWAGMVAHNGTCGVGREEDWSSHCIEHELSALYDVAHGAGLAVIMPAWMQYVMQHDVARFNQFAQRVWGCEMDFAHPERTARHGIECFRRFLHDIGMPLSFAELGAKEEDIPALVAKLGATEEDKLGSFLPLGPADIESIYRLAL